MVFSVVRVGSPFTRNSMGCFVTVSYTHLDVYKRQASLLVLSAILELLRTVTNTAPMATKQRQAAGRIEQTGTLQFLIIARTHNPVP